MVQTDGLLGVWWYNDGRSYYKIVRGEEVSPQLQNRLMYVQTLTDGKDLMGELVPAPTTPTAPTGWSHRADLTNQASISFRLLSENVLMSTYRKAGSEEWRTPTRATKGDEPTAIKVQDKDVLVEVNESEKRWSLDGRAYSKAQFRAFFGGLREWELAPAFVEGKAGPKAVSWRGEDQEHVHKEVASSLLAGEVWSALGEEEERDAAISCVGFLRARLLKALPAVNGETPQFLSVMPSLPLAAKVSEDTLDDVADRLAEKPDPRKTIVPVPAVRLMPTLAHPVSPNEEQMLRLFVADPRNQAYSLCHQMRLQAKTDPVQLEFSHSLILRRHDVLRSAYWMEGTDPLRKVNAEHQGPLFVMAVANEGEAAAIVGGTDYMTGHQLGVTPIRCHAFASHLSSGLVGANLHHIVADADGLGLYFQEVTSINMMLAAGFSEEAVAERLPQLPVQFIDYAYWQKSLMSQGHLDGELSYWVNEVISCTPPAVLDVPIDTPRPRVWVAVGSSSRLLLDVELTNLVSQASGKATPFAVCLATMAVTLARFNGTNGSLIAVPFALRSLPALMSLIGNFLNMMPMYGSIGQGETFMSAVNRMAVQAVNVQRYSLAPFLTLVNLTQPHFGRTDPSRNPVYATMIDLVPNESEEPSSGLSGVLDWFLFANTRNGAIWSLDAVFNTFILQSQTVRMMLLKLMAVQYQVSRDPKAVVPRSLPSVELAEPCDDGVLLTHVKVKNGFLPQIIGLKSGWDFENASQDCQGARAAARLKRMSCLELTADYPPEKLSAMRPPGPGRQPKLQPRREVRAGGEEAVLAKAIKRPNARSEEELAEEAEAKRAELARRKQKSYEVASRWALAARQAELIPLDEEDENYDPYYTDDPRRLREILLGTKKG